MILANQYCGDSLINSHYLQIVKEYSTENPGHMKENLERGHEGLFAADNSFQEYVKMSQEPEGENPYKKEDYDLEKAEDRIKYFKEYNEDMYFRCRKSIITPYGKLNSINYKSQTSYLDVNSDIELNRLQDNKLKTRIDYNIDEKDDILGSIAAKDYGVKILKSSA
mmetsp:Transcript_41440/g.36812  ORF Transcript_41440/g.36812 Transcript_41440/m.36812 type:complete len:166 (+) Transcript_41440:273-770(+)